MERERIGKTWLRRHGGGIFAERECMRRCPEEGCPEPELVPVWCRVCGSEPARDGGHGNEGSGATAQRIWEAATKARKKRNEEWWRTHGPQCPEEARPDPEWLGAREGEYWLTTDNVLSDDADGSTFEHAADGVGAQAGEGELPWGQ